MINWKGINELENAKNIGDAIGVVKKYNLSDFDVRSGLRKGAVELEYVDHGDPRGMSKDVYMYYKTLSSIYPYTNRGDVSPVQILEFIRDKGGAKMPDATDEKGIIKFFTGATDKAVDEVLRIKNALNRISTSTVSHILHSINNRAFVDHQPWNTREIVHEMKQSYECHIQDGDIDKGALRGFDSGRYAKEIQGILPDILSQNALGERSTVIDLLGGQIEDATDYFVRSAIQKSGGYSVLFKDRINENPIL